MRIYPTAKKIQGRKNGDDLLGITDSLVMDVSGVWIRKTDWMSLFVFFISLVIVAQHVSVQPCAHHQELTTA